jgi:uncharacterized protein (TIGR02757 family)
VRRAAGPPNLALLGERLEALRREWRSRRLDSDPLVFAHRYADPADREVVAFAAASLAFGRVASIQASIARVLGALGPRPAAFLDEWDERPIAGLERFVHRWVTGQDIGDFLLMVKRARRAHGSLGALFAKGDEREDFLEGEEGGPQARRGTRGARANRAAHSDYVAALSSFHRNLLSFSSPAASGLSSIQRNLRALSPRGEALSRGMRFLLPSPESGSACKRSHLFLRWMIRTEGFDLGLWTGGRFTPVRLLLPMDTHVHRIARTVGLTRRPTPDLAAAREATGWLRRLKPQDPVAYDWPLSRLGILGLPVPLPAARA